VGRLVLAVAVSAVVAGTLAPAAGAETFVANRLGDPPPGGCRPAACTLREAVIAANSSAGNDRILLRAGARYRLRRAGIDDAAAVGDLDVTDPVTIRARGHGRATIDATRTDRVLDIPDPGARSRLVRLALRGGDGAGAGGINAESRLILVRSVIAGNRGTDDGGIRAGAGLTARASRIVNNRGGAGFDAAGGLDSDSPTDDVLIAATEISGNRGGGIGGAEIEGPATIVSSEISANPGRPGMAAMGGGLRLNGPTRIDRTTIARNIGQSVGGIDAEGLGGGDQLAVLRSRIRANRAVEAGFGDGAGIKAYARLRLVRSEVRGNRAGGGGGGVANRGERTVIATTILRANRSDQEGGGLALTDTGAPHLVRISRSTLRDNHAVGDGGGLSFVVAEPSSFLQAVNSTVAGNRADDNGGGLELRGGVANLNALTVARNRADADEAAGGAGGGIYQGDAFGVGAAVVVSNSLLALNRVGPDGSDPQCSGTYTSGGGNLITARPGCTDLAGPQDLVRANPRIGRLGAHGGPTPTIPLRRRSPAINSARGTAPSRDQRGVRRRNPDIGAYERR